MIGKERETIHSDDEYKKYWEMSEAERQNFLKQSYASRNAKDRYATSRDLHARELEIQAIRMSLAEKGSLLDLGCGNGYTLISLGGDLEDWELTGVDFSSNLVEGAHHLLQESLADLKSHPRFHCADAFEYVARTSDRSVDYVLTERFIQNAPSVAWQKKLVRDIFRVLRHGGRFLMCEGSKRGFDALNHLRSAMGLEVIPDSSADNVSAIRIDDLEFEHFAQADVGFFLLKKLGFSHYFVTSRVLQPLLCAPSAPRFDSEINRYARLMQEQMPFVPGYGSNVLWVFEKR